MTHDQLIEWFACKVCEKPMGLDPDECHSTIGRQNPLCINYKCCRIKEKSSEQLKYVGSPIDKNIFLKACPGGGKTEVVGLKAAYEIRRWDRPVGGIAVLTFTNNAADVIHERVCQFAGVDKAGYPHFIGTLSSWLQGYVVSPFAHILTGYEGLNGDRSIRLVENTADSDFLKRYQTKAYPRSGPIKANEYSWDCEEKEYIFASRSRNVDAVRQAIEFTDEQKQELKKTKRDFMGRGFATHQDIEFLCLRLMEKHKVLAERVSERFPLILVDECQDLSWTEMAILKQLQKFSTSLHFIGDLKQAIYEFKNVAPKKVEAFAVENCFSEMSLSDNFRSCQSIVSVCKSVVLDQSHVKGMGEAKSKTPCLFRTYQKESIHLLPQWFTEFVERKRLDVGKTAIVARGWSTVSKLRPCGISNAKNDQIRLAMAINLWKLGVNQAMGDALKYIGQFVAHRLFPKWAVNAREYYCPECVSSTIQWRLFLARILDSLIKIDDVADFNQAWKHWAKSVRKYFHVVANKQRRMLTDYLTESMDVFQQISFNALSSVSNAVADSLPNTPQQKTVVRITTIHSVKGETLDAIMLVSAPSKQGTSDGHWEQWLDAPSSEAARLAYVASSRPRFLLIWAIPEQKSADYKKLKKLGLKPVRLEDSSG